jgi:hypothetical protein
MDSKYWFVVEGLFEVRSDGTINYLPGYTPEKASQAFDTWYNSRTTMFDSHGPAIEGHEIAVIKKIEETK